MPTTKPTSGFVSTPASGTKTSGTSVAVGVTIGTTIGRKNTSETATDTSGDLVDSLGVKLSTGCLYKIRFADGTELGSGHLGLGSVLGHVPLATPRKSNSGAIFSLGGTWKPGSVGYLKGKYSGLEGKSASMTMSLSSTGVLTWWHYTDPKNEAGSSYGFTARQMPNRRIALYGYDEKRKECGLVVVGDQIVKDPSNLGVALDCYFVRVT